VDTDRIEIARRAYAAFNRSGVDGILGFLDPQIEWRMWSGFARDTRVFRGHSGVREVLGIFQENFDDFRAEPEEFIDAGGCVVVSVRLGGNAKGSGEPQHFDVFQVWAARGSKAIRLDVCGSREEAMEVALNSPTERGLAKK